MAEAGLAGISVPFALSYRPLFTGLGVIAGYLAAILGLSFYARRRIGAKRWRNLHRATPVVYVLALIHTLGAGTDAGAPWLRAIVLAPAIPAAVLLVARLTRKRRRAPAAPGLACGAEGGGGMTRIVIAGGGLAAQRAAETLRALGHDGPITMLAAEPRAPYDRPPLSKAILAGERPDLALRPAGWHRDHGVELLAGTPATGLGHRGPPRPHPGRRHPLRRAGIATGATRSHSPAFRTRSRCARSTTRWSSRPISSRARASPSSAPA